MPLIQQCGTIQSGYDKECPSGNFGLKERGVTGRNGNAIAGVLIRCIPEGYGEPCFSTGNLKKESEEFRQSYNYVIKADGEIWLDVPENATSWALLPKLVQDESQLPNVVYNVEHPECKTLDWGIINIPPATGYIDDVLLTIAIEVPKIGGQAFLAWGHKACDCLESCKTLSRIFTEWQTYKLARLIKWIFEQHPSLTLNETNLQFFQNINDCCIDECGCEPQVSELVCLATNFCEPIKNQAGGFVEEGGIAFVYGFDAKGLPIKEEFGDFIKRTLYWNTTTNRPQIRLSNGNFINLNTTA